MSIGGRTRSKSHVSSSGKSTSSSATGGRTTATARGKPKAVPRERRPFASSVGVRSKMQRQARRDTQPELALRRSLHRLGLRFRVDVPIVPSTRRRRVDIVFPKARVAVLVDGCYWHGCPAHSSAGPRENAWYWGPKLLRNRERDRDTDQRLTTAGWQVLRVWEHEPPDEAAGRVADVVRARSGANLLNRRPFEQISGAEEPNRRARATAGLSPGSQVQSTSARTAQAASNSGRSAARR